MSNEQIKEIISKLTHRQKADLLTGRDFWSTRDIPEHCIPSAYLADGPHGVRKQKAASDHLGLNVSIEATCYPTAATMANSWNPHLGEEMGIRLGGEAVAQHVNVLLGPGMNIKRNPRCGRNFEYFSEDPYLAGKMAAAYVRGIQKNGISACLKHFAANNQEERRMVLDSVIDERTLREIYLTGFEIAVEEGKPGTIMSSYNLLNGEFTNENPHLMLDILRKEWGFNGMVVTDWAGCNDRVKGVEVGNELEMPSCKYGADDVFKALEEGKLDEKKVDECLERLLDFVFRTEAVVEAAPKEFDVEVHHEMARKCAEECIVLLKNDNNVLPLKQEKVCFIGDFANKPRFQGAGSSVVNPTKTEKFIEEQKKHLTHFVGYAQGFERFGKKSNKLAKKAMNLARKSDTIVFFAGLDEVTEAEGLDRVNTKIPANQLLLLERLYALKKKVIVVLFCGSMVELGNITKADGIVHAYLGGQAGVSALLNVLTGKVNPSGKLSESYPISYADCSTAKYFHDGKALTAEYREGLYVGYRYYDTVGKKVAYPFGYGLSYTTYEYSDLKVTDKGISLKVKNTGAVDGKEIVQLYVGKKSEKIFRPSKELKGFAKVLVKAGESVNVEIPFDSRTFRNYNPKANAWQVEGGEWQIMVGASSADIRLNGTITVAGNATDFGYDAVALKDYFAGTIENVPDGEFENILGRSLPQSDYPFIRNKKGKIPKSKKRRRMVIHENCTIDDLRYARGWTGRLFAWGINFARGFFWKTGNKTMANTLTMGMVHQPIRGLAKFGSMTRRQMEGMLLMFNGKFFKGLHTFLSKEKKKK